jgi:hypothetical protein
LSDLDTTIPDSSGHHPFLVFAYLPLSDYHHPGFFVITALAFCVTPAELLILNDYHPAWFQAPPRP